MADKDPYPIQEEKSKAMPESGGRPPDSGDPDPPRPGSLLRLVLLILLLVALVAFAFYYFVGLPGVPEPAPQIQKKTIQVPPWAEPMTPEGAASEAAPPTPAPSEKAPPAKSGVSSPPAKSPAAGHQDVDRTAVAATVSTPAGEPVAGVVAGKGAPGTFTVQVGIFLLDTSRRRAERLVSELGYAPQVAPRELRTPLVRLRVGSYALAEARSRLAALQAAVPGAFLVAAGDRGTLYAGTYCLPGETRRAVERLGGRGIRVDREPIEAPVTMQRVYFGPFTKRQAATAAARRARAAGLETLVLERSGGGGA